MVPSKSRPEAAVDLAAAVRIADSAAAVAAAIAGASPAGSFEIDDNDSLGPLSPGLTFQAGTAPGSRGR